MVRHLPTFIFSVVCILAIAPAAGAGGTAMLPGDAAHGKKLHDAQCVGCHNTAMYTAKDRKIKTVEGLMAQVAACNNNLKQNLSSQQMDDLVSYLNETFYKFE